MLHIKKLVTLLISKTPYHKARITSLDATIRTGDDGSLLLILSLRAGLPSLSLLTCMKIAGAMILAQINHLSIRHAASTRLSRRIGFESR